MAYKSYKTSEKAQKHPKYGTDGALTSQNRGASAPTTKGKEIPPHKIFTEAGDETRYKINKAALNQLNAKYGNLKSIKDIFTSITTELALSDGSRVSEMQNSKEGSSWFKQVITGAEPRTGNFPHGTNGKTSRTDRRTGKKSKGQELAPIKGKK